MNITLYLVFVIVRLFVCPIRSLLFQVALNPYMRVSVAICHFDWRDLRMKKKKLN